MPKRKGRGQGRRARGTGSIFFSQKRGRWIGRVPIGRTPGGKTVYKELWGRLRAKWSRR